jgi:hypothetical protein
MSEKTGFSIGYLSMIENGLRPPLQAARKIAAALDRKPGDFWEGM